VCGSEFDHSKEQNVMHMDKRLLEESSHNNNSSKPELLILHFRKVIGDWLNYLQTISLQREEYKQF